MLRRYASFLAGRAIPDANSGLRALRRAVVVPLLRLLPDGFSFSTTSTLAMLTSGREVVYVAIRYRPRVGRSKIRPMHDALSFVLRDLTEKTLLFLEFSHNAGMFALLADMINKRGPGG